MPEKNKQNWSKELPRKIIMSFQIISSLALGIFIIAVLYFALKYFDVSLYTSEQIIEAQKIGNWEFPDNNYVLKNVENLLIENKDIIAVTIKDKKSGNTLIVFELNFSRGEILKIKDSIQNQLLEKYGLSKFYLKSSGNMTGGIGEEIVYNVIGWGSGDGARTGIIGSLDCLRKQEIGSNILVFVFNSSAKYSEERALAFINSLNCPAGSGNGGGDGNVGDKLDTDGDGLTDKVEKMLGSDPYKKDTDDDGYNDFEELQSGYSPMLPRPWDKYTSEEFAKVKRDIKYVNVDVYNKLFGGN